MNVGKKNLVAGQEDLIPDIILKNQKFKKLL